jgi:hypothetical protein
MTDIEYRKENDVHRAVTEDGFAITISSPCSMYADFRDVDVWVIGYLTPVCHSQQFSLYLCKKRAAKMLQDFRRLAEHFREQGRAEVRAAQGALAEAMTETEEPEVIATGSEAFLAYSREQRRIDERIEGLHNAGKGHAE